METKRTRVWISAGGVVGGLLIVALLASITWAPRKDHKLTALERAGFDSFGRRQFRMVQGGIGMHIEPVTIESK